LGISGHHLIFAVFKVARSNPKPKVISTRNYKSLDIKQLRSDFDQASWHITDLFDDIDDSVDAWQYLYNEMLHHHLPSRDVRIRDKSLSWINTSIRKEMNKRNKLLKKAKSSGDPELWSLYKQKRLEVKKLLKSAEAAYWQKLFKEATNLSEFWKLGNQVLRKHKIKNIGPICDHNGEIIIHDLKKAEYFNDFFVNVSEDLTK